MKQDDAPVKAKPLSPFVKPVDPRGVAKAQAEWEAHFKKNGPIAPPPIRPVMVPRDLQKNAAFSGSVPYWGLGEFSWYTNDGAESTPGTNNERWRSCGQAAAATVLRYWKAIPNTPGNTAVRDLYNQYPADGYLAGIGTSWQREQSMLKDKGLRTSILKGETDLLNTVGNGIPVIVLLDTAKFKDWDYKWGGHWVVVYGYTKSNIYLTNWSGNNNCTPRTEFMAGWRNNNIVNAGGFSECGLVGQGSRGHV